MRARRYFGFGLLLLVTLGLLLRLAPLGRYVTPDEPAWVERSVRFADALAARDWNSIPSTGHPGVTTMWLGTAGLVAHKWLAPAESLVHLDWIRRLAWLAPQNGEAFVHLSFFLPCGRFAVALTNSLGLMAVYLLLVRLFDRSVAFIAAGFLAFDPFVVGHSGLLHTDGLLATFSTLSVISLLMAVQNGQGAGAWALVSGVTAGLALLTKSLGAYLVIFLWVVLGFSWLLGRIELSQAFRWSILWGLAAAVVYVGLYPAMWAAPLETLRDVLLAPVYQSTTAMMPTFFAGRVALQHGPQFYVVALLFRLSPVILIGLLLGIWMQITGQAARRELLWLALFSLGYVLLLMLNVKRYQRYLLPVVSPLTILAAVSISDAWHWKFRVNISKSPLIVLLQLLLLLPFAAHPLTSRSLLFGGPWVGARLLSADWGEGMGAAARWLNQRSDAGRLTVAASSVPSFASVFRGHTVPLEQVSRADYVVHAIPQASRPSFGRPVAYTATLCFLDHAVVLTNTASLEQATYLADKAAPGDLILVDADTPLLRRYGGPGRLVSVAPLPDEQAIARLLERETTDWGSIWRVASSGASSITARHLRRQLEGMATPVSTTVVADASVTRYVLSRADSTEHASSHMATFGGQLTLVDSAFPSTVAWPEDLPLMLRWRLLAQPAVDYRAVVMLRDSTGHAWTSAESLIRSGVNFPTSAWSVGDWSDSDYGLSLPPGIPPARYTVEVSVFDSASGAGSGATDPSGAFRGTRIVLGKVSVAPATQSPADVELDLNEWLRITAGPLTLLGFDPPDQHILTGDFLSFSLMWQADAAVAEDQRVRFQLVDSDGHSEYEAVRPVSIYPPSQWRIGDRIRSHYSLHIPPELSPGSYSLTLNVVGGEGLPLWERDQTLTTLDVAPRERSFTLSKQPPRELDLAFGRRIHLLGYELKATEAHPGDTLPLTLYWQADGPTQRSYTLFVHLRGPNGGLHGQVDRIPGDDGAPTSSWAPGQVIKDHVSLPIASEAPAGTYHIVIGFYDSAYGDRLPVADASGELFLNDEAVLPSDVTVSGD